MSAHILLVSTGANNGATHPRTPSLLPTTAQAAEALYQDRMVSHPHWLGHRIPGPRAVLQGVHAGAGKGVSRRWGAGIAASEEEAADSAGWSMVQSTRPAAMLKDSTDCHTRQVQVMSTLPLKAMSRIWGRFNELNIPYYLRVPGFKLYSFIFGVK